MASNGIASRHENNLVGTPPCELNCEHQEHCKTNKKACRQYVRYAAHGDIKEHLPREPKAHLYEH